jgi:hypothetical protein
MDAEWQRPDLPGNSNDENKATLRRVDAGHLFRLSVYEFRHSNFNAQLP